LENWPRGYLIAYAHNSNDKALKKIPFS